MIFLEAFPLGMPLRCCGSISTKRHFPMGRKNRFQIDSLKGINFHIRKSATCGQGNSLKICLKGRTINTFCQKKLKRLQLYLYRSITLSLTPTLEKPPSW